MSMRKYLYLITEHEEEERVGLCNVTDRPFTDAEKNSEGTLSVFNRETGDFRDVGKLVGLGYADFDSESTYESEIGDVIDRKLSEVDEGWLEKAGLEGGE